MADVARLGAEVGRASIVVILALASACSPQEELPHKATLDSVVSEAEVAVYRAITETVSDTVFVLPVVGLSDLDLQTIRESPSRFAAPAADAWTLLGMVAGASARIPDSLARAYSLHVVPEAKVTSTRRAPALSVQYLEFSRVAFSPSGNAAVFVHSGCGFDCGGAMYVLLRRTGGRWEVVEVASAWIV